MILFADTRNGGFYRGLTYFSWSINPPTAQYPYQSRWWARIPLRLRSTPGVAPS